MSISPVAGWDEARVPWKMVRRLGSTHALLSGRGAQADLSRVPWQTVDRIHACIARLEPQRARSIFDVRASTALIGLLEHVTSLASLMALQLSAFAGNVHACKRMHMCLYLAGCMALAFHECRSQS
eukprot:6210737-Pleurochrysis_carterae.AAC.4